MTKQRLLILTLIMMASAAQANLLTDPQWQAWLDNGKTSELARAAEAKLNAQPDDTQSAVALALIALEDAEPQRLDAALKPMQACADRQPAQAVCFYALGSVQGLQAMSGGMMTAIRLSGQIKNNLTRAVELDPLLYEARSALIQFYLMAPGVAGGSLAKARELATAAQPRQPEHAKLLRATIAAQDKQWPEMERELLSIRPGDDKRLQGETRQAWGQLGASYLSDKQFPKARAIFEQLMRDAPMQALGPYGLARVMTETAQPDEAIKLLERARSLEGGDKLPIDHRLGIALLAKGDKPQAKAVLERFVASKKANPRNLDDAKKRLAELS